MGCRGPRPGLSAGVLDDYPNKSRAALFSLLAGVLVMLVASRQWRMILMALLLAIAGVLAVSHLRPGALERYGAALDIASYQGGNLSVSLRYRIWAGMVDINAERPWLGYGPGWKKLPTVATEGGFIDKWKNSDDVLMRDTAEYFSWSVGKVNPHNLYLQVLFEAGALGLLALLSLSLAVLVAAWRSLRGAGRSRAGAVTWFGLAGAGFITSWLIGGFANGYWSELTPLFLLAGVAWALRQISKLPADG